VNFTGQATAIMLKDALYFRGCVVIISLLYFDYFVF